MVLRDIRCGRRLSQAVALNAKWFSRIHLEQPAGQWLLKRWPGCTCIDVFLRRLRNNEYNFSAGFISSGQQCRRTANASQWNRRPFTINGSLLCGRCATHVLFRQCDKWCECHFNHIYRGPLLMSSENALFLETIRISPSAFLFAKKCTQPIRLADYDGSELLVERGTSVQLPVYAIHHDAQYYERPNEFRPERFDEVSADERRKAGLFLPFGSGPRLCLGKKLPILLIVDAEYPMSAQQRTNNGIKNNFCWQVSIFPSSTNCAFFSRRPTKTNASKCDAKWKTHMRNKLPWNM